MLRHPAMELTENSQLMSQRHSRIA